MNDTRDPDAPESGFQPGVEADDTATTDQSAISPAFVSRVVGAIGDGDKPYLWRTVKELHPADLADLLEHLPPDAFRKGIHLLGKDLPAEAVAELSDTARADALQHTGLLSCGKGTPLPHQRQHGDLQLWATAMQRLQHAQSDQVFPMAVAQHQQTAGHPVTDTIRQGSLLPHGGMAKW